MTMQSTVLSPNQRKLIVEHARLLSGFDPGADRRLLTPLLERIKAIECELEMPPERITKLAVDMYQAQRR